MKDDEMPKAKTVSEWSKEANQHFKDENGWIYPKIQPSLFETKGVQLGKTFTNSIYAKFIKELGKMKHEEIVIKIVNNGFYVSVGCQNFVFTTEKELFQAISEYKKDPEKAQEKYCNK